MEYDKIINVHNNCFWTKKMKIQKELRFEKVLEFNVDVKPTSLAIEGC